MRLGSGETVGYTYSRIDVMVFFFYSRTIPDIVLFHKFSILFQSFHIRKAAYFQRISNPHNFLRYAPHHGCRENLQFRAAEDQGHADNGLHSAPRIGGYCNNINHCQNQSVPGAFMHLCKNRSHYEMVFADVSERFSLSPILSSTVPETSLERVSE